MEWAGGGPETVEEEKCYEHFGDVMIVKSVWPSDFFHLKSQQDLDFWQVDEYCAMTSLVSDMAVRKAMWVRGDNPIHHRIKIPLFYGANGRVSLWEKANRMVSHLDQNSRENQEVNNKLMEYFGPDPQCPGWNPASSALFESGFFIQSTILGPAGFEPHLPKACRFVIAGGLLLALWARFNYRQSDPVLLLWNPSSHSESSTTASNAARFRHDVIWPLFGSTKVFWEMLGEQFFASSAYIWPKETPGLTVPQIRDVLLRYHPSNDPIIYLSYAYESLIGSSPNASHRLNQDLGRGGLLPFEE